MIGLFSKEIHLPLNRVNINNLDLNLVKIKKIDDKYCRYVTKLYNEFYKLIHTNNIEKINCELLNNYSNNIIDIKDNIDDIRKCDLIISPSHSDTYHLIKEMNSSPNEELLVICFDMHSDTYDYNTKLWKGNVFSKLLKEKIITNFIVVGVPKKKVKNTINDVPSDLIEKVIIKKNFCIKKNIKKIKPTRIFISIDIDCLDTRKKQYSALEYCPFTILYYLSTLNLSEDSKEETIEKVKNCIYVKNELGYANLYKTGENKLNVKKIIKSINKIKKYCYKKKITLGFDNKMYFDITEVNGYDYDKKTLECLTMLIDELI